MQLFTPVHAPDAVVSTSTREPVTPAKQAQSLLLSTPSVLLSQRTHAVALTLDVTCPAGHVVHVSVEHTARLPGVHVDCTVA